MINLKRLTAGLLVTGFFSLSSHSANAGVYEWVQWAFGFEKADPYQNFSDLVIDVKARIEQEQEEARIQREREEAEFQNILAQISAMEDAARPAQDDRI